MYGRLASAHATTKIISPFSNPPIAPATTCTLSVNAPTLPFLLPLPVLQSALRITVVAQTRWRQTIIRMRLQTTARAHMENAITIK